MTLQERLVSEFWEKYGNPDSLSSASQFHPDVQGKLPQAINDFILHTIEQTIKEGCEVVEELKRKHNCPPDDGNDYDHGAYVALTDTQHALRGIIG